jgi:uncharacterized membrane protein (UPF0127 family)
LLGRDGLEPSSAMMIEPCAAVHTAFMRFAIDVVFIDRHGYTVKIARNVAPWRIAMAARAHAVVEMAAGSLDRVDLALGDRLCLSPAACGARAPEGTPRARVAATAAS